MKWVTDQPVQLHVVKSGESSKLVVRIPDVYAPALFLAQSDVITPDQPPPLGLLQRLSRYDVEHQAQLIPNPRAWLVAFGDLNVAADAMRVHSSTFRYRSAESPKAQATNSPSCCSFRLLANRQASAAYSAPVIRRPQAHAQAVEVPRPQTASAVRVLYDHSVLDDQHDAVGVGPQTRLLERIEIHHDQIGHGPFGHNSKRGLTENSRAR